MGSEKAAKAAAQGADISTVEAAEQVRTGSTLSLCATHCCSVEVGSTILYEPQSVTQTPLLPYCSYDVK